MIMIRVSIILLLCIGLLPELSRSSSTSVARNDVKYRVGQSGYDGVSETFFLQISVSEQDITRQRLERLVCELKLRYSKYSRLSVAIFTTYKAAKITNFTYEQEGYTDLEQAYRARYWIDHNKGEEWLKYFPSPPRRGERMQPISLSDHSPPC